MMAAVKNVIEYFFIIDLVSGNIEAKTSSRIRTQSVCQMRNRANKWNDQPGTHVIRHSHSLENTISFRHYGGGDAAKASISKKKGPALFARPFTAL